ncbi:MAG: hypothetical protein HQK49_22330 [Oligoflexia bacterium]|nr:hypothetical protein [Oligoflexia bacterium]
MEFGSFLIALSVNGCIKIIVMILCVILLIRMSKIKKNLSAESLFSFNIIFYSLLMFSASELSCAIETYVLMHSHYIGRIIHSICSSMGMATFSVGIYMLVDQRLVHFGLKRCTMLQVCKSCTLNKDAGHNSGRCRFSTIILLGSILLCFLCIPPFFASTEPMYINSSNYILPFESLNNWFDQTFIPFVSQFTPYKSLSASMILTTAPQILDYRIAPTITFILTFIGIILFLSNSFSKQSKGVYFIVFASGIIAYSYYQLILYRITNDILVEALGHEVGELLYLIVLTKLLTIFYSNNNDNDDAKKRPA